MDRETAEKRKRDDLETLRWIKLHPHRRLTEEQGERLKRLEEELNISPDNPA